MQHNESLVLLKNITEKHNIPSNRCKLLLKVGVSIKQIPSGNNYSLYDLICGPRTDC